MLLHTFTVSNLPVFVSQRGIYALRPGSTVIAGLGTTINIAQPLLINGAISSHVRAYRLLRTCSYTLQFTDSVAIIGKATMRTVVCPTSETVRLYKYTVENPESHWRACL